HVATAPAGQAPARSLVFHLRRLMAGFSPAMTFPLLAAAVSPSNQGPKAAQACAAAPNPNQAPGLAPRLMRTWRHSRTHGHWRARLLRPACSGNWLLCKTPQDYRDCVPLLNKAVGNRAPEYPRLLGGDAEPVIYGRT